MTMDMEAVLTRDGEAETVSYSHTKAMAEQWVNAGYAPGISVVMALDTDHRATVNVGKLGLWDDAPAVTYNSLWRQYSMTKSVTALAAMVAIDEGKMKLDEPIYKFIREFEYMTVLDEQRDGEGIGMTVKARRPASRPITVRHLMTHTAGMGYSMVKGPLEEMYLIDGINPFQLNRDLEKVEKLKRADSLQGFALQVAKLPLFADPGTVWAYSIGLDVLAAVIEKAVGQSFESYVKEKIFDKLGMESSFWQVPHALHERMSTNFITEGSATNLIAFDTREKSVWYDKPSFAYGGAGLAMSALDYDQLLYMLMNKGTLNGVKILEPATVALALSDLLYGLGIDLSRLEKMIGAPKDGAGFGAGGYVLTKAPTDPHDKRSVGTYGWGGFAGTCFWLDPVKRVRACGMVNVIPHIDKTPYPHEVSVIGPLIQSVYKDLT